MSGSEPGGGRPAALTPVYAYEAVVRMEQAEDPAAVGAAVTLALCGDWRHEPPCPLAPHHTRADRHQDTVTVRVVFVTQPPLEAEVRQRIEDAVRGGSAPTPDGGTAHWTLVSSRDVAVEEDERELGRRLTASAPTLET